jgi:hypothetical protein
LAERAYELQGCQESLAQRILAEWLCSRFLSRELNRKTRRMHLVDLSVLRTAWDDCAHICRRYGLHDYPVLRPASIYRQASECLRAWYGQPARKSFDDDAIGAMEGELPANGEEGIEADDSANYDDSDVEDGPHILDGGGADEGSDEENTAAGTVGEDDDIY